MLSEYNPTKNDFSFQRVRFDFEALGTRHFPEGKAGNVVRGALGWAMRELSPEAYTKFFEPRQRPGTGPSGFASLPRLFVLRAHHLDGRTVQPSETFHVDLHLFRNTPADAFIGAFQQILMGRLRHVTSDTISVSLESLHAGIESLALRFLTPTELKLDSGFSALPGFPVVFSRARDRIRALSDHPLTLDFTGMAQRAARVALVSHRLTHHRLARTSSKTGQTHPIGGFTGEAIYEGALDEFVPLLEAAHWTGIGRQTVWGKGVTEIGKM
jgi:CRISPR-associated endoribonuclease Cas6